MPSVSSASHATPPQYTPLEEVTLPFVETVSKRLFEQIHDLRRQSGLTLEDRKRRVSEIRQGRDSVVRLSQLLQTTAEQRAHAFRWWNLYRLVQLIGFYLARSGFFLYFGAEGANHRAARAILSNLTKSSENLVESQLDILATEKIARFEINLLMIEIYDELEKLEPGNKKTAEALADWLFAEGAADEAEVRYSNLRAYQEGFENELRVQLKHILALITQEKYGDAEEEIVFLKTRVDEELQKKANPKLAALYEELSERKADCLVGQKKYDEALKVIRDLLKNHPSDRRLGEKCMTYWLHSVLAKYPEKLSGTDIEYFVVQPRIAYHAIFGLQTLQDDNLIIEFTFWLNTYLSQPKLYENEAFREVVKRKLDSMLKSGLVLPEQVLQALERKCEALNKKQLHFQESLLQFIRKLPEHEHDFDKRVVSILQGRKRELEHLVHPHEGGDSSIGIILQQQALLAMTEAAQTCVHFKPVHLGRKLLSLNTTLTANKRSLEAHGEAFKRVLIENKGTLSRLGFTPLNKNSW